MFIQSIKNFPFFYSLLLIGLICLFLTFIIFCEYLHNDPECNVHLFLTNQFQSKENILLYSILLFFITNLIFSLKRNQNFLLGNISPFASLRSFWFWQFGFKIYNSILEAFRRGIIHPQVYNFIVVSR